MVTCFVRGSLIHGVPSSIVPLRYLFAQANVTPHDLICEVHCLDMRQNLIRMRSSGLDQICNLKHGWNLWKLLAKVGQEGVSEKNGMEGDIRMCMPLHQKGEQEGWKRESLLSL
jgi:hypothetical protein